MIYYILSHPRLTRSAIPLAKKLSELCGEEIKALTVVQDYRNDATCIIRYGTSAFPFRVDTNYNSSELIRLAGNKLGLSRFLSKEDINIRHIEYYIEEEPKEFPIVLRTELNRGGGVGIKIIETKNDFIPDYMNYAWTKWYDFKFELGVHILGGKVARVFKKVRSEGLDDEKYPIRNTQRGYDFVLKPRWQGIYTGLDEFVASIYDKFPIQFARLDIGYDKNTGGYRLIEINSAPDLSQNINTLNMYAEFLANAIKQNE